MRGRGQTLCQEPGPEPAPLTLTALLGGYPVLIPQVTEREGLSTGFTFGEGSGEDGRVNGRYLRGRDSKEDPRVISCTKFRAASLTPSGLRWNGLFGGPARSPATCLPLTWASALSWQVLPIIVFFSCVMSVLYYVGLMQWVILKVSSQCHGLCSPRVPCSQSQNLPVPCTESLDLSRIP